MGPCTNCCILYILHNQPTFYFIYYIMGPQVNYIILYKWAHRSIVGGLYKSAGMGLSINWGLFSKLAPHQLWKEMTNLAGERPRGMKSKLQPLHWIQIVLMMRQQWGGGGGKRKALQVSLVTTSTHPRYKRTHGTHPMTNNIIPLSCLSCI